MLQIGRIARSNQRGQGSANSVLFQNNKPRLLQQFSLPQCTPANAEKSALLCNSADFADAAAGRRAAEYGREHEWAPGRKPPAPHPLNHPLSG
jgi:hypothetical protein